MKQPKFSIIVPHYDGVIPDETFLEGMDSILCSKYKNFEVLVYHDGPTSRPIPQSFKSAYDYHNIDYKIRETKTRYNDWGHSLRDLGIREASGEYIVHFNPDNILYPDVLEGISTLDDDIIICPIILEGTVRKTTDNTYMMNMYRTRDPKDCVLLDGFPAVHQNIDAMQLVMKTELWRKFGGWYDKSEQSDGIMYQEFCKKAQARYSHHIIGVHR